LKISNLVDRLERERGEIFAMPEGDTDGTIQWQRFDTCFYLSFNSRDLLEIRPDKRRPMQIGDRVEFYHAQERKSNLDKKLAKFIIPARARRYQVTIF